MEFRIAVLETKLEQVERELSKVRADAFGPKSDVTMLLPKSVSDLPSKGFIVSVTAAALVLFTIMITCQQQIQALFDLTP